VIPKTRDAQGRNEWIYLLSGHVRLVLGDDDWVLAPGEVVEFETQVPHWFGSTGLEPADVVDAEGGLLGEPPLRRADRRERGRRGHARTGGRFGTDKARFAALRG
jgi:mannose-6-phosphate isomerase-like protein (cupin superfamily)